MDRLTLRLSRGSSMFALGGVASIVGLVLTSVVAARAMGVETFTAYAAMVSVLGVLGTGVAGAMEQESARRIASRTDASSTELPLVPAALAALVAQLIVVVPGEWQRVLFGEHRLVAILFLVLGLAAFHAGAIARGVLAGSGHRALLGLAIALTGTLPVVVGVLLMALGVDAFVAFGVGTVVGAASSALVVIPVLPRHRRGSLQPVRGDGSRSFLGLVAGNLFLTANMVAVPAVLRLHVDDLSATVVASLQIAVSLSRLSTLLVAQGVSAVVAAASRQAHGRSFAGAVAGAAALGAVAVLVTAALSPSLLPLVFGSGFEIDFWDAMFAALSVLFLNPAYVLTGVAVARRRNSLIASAWGAGACALVVVAAWPGDMTVALVLSGITVAALLPAVILALGLAAPSASPQLGE